MTSEVDIVDVRSVHPALNFLAMRGLILGRCLEYGSKTEALQKAYGMQSFTTDEVWSRPDGKFQTIISVLSMSTIRPHILALLLSDMKSMLTPSGKIYLIVPKSIQGLTDIKLPSLPYDDPSNIIFIAY